MDRSSSRATLVEKYGEPPNLHNVNNDIILRMSKGTAKMPTKTSALWLLEWKGLSLPTKLVSSKTSRVVKKASKLRGDALETYKRQTFIFLTLPQMEPILISSPPPSQITMATTQTINETNQDNQTPSTSYSQTHISLLQTYHSKRVTPKKKLNTTLHQLSLNERKLAAQEKKLKKLKDEIKEQEKIKGHYSIINVKNREKRSVAIRQKLREERNKHRLIGKRMGDKNQQLKEKLHELNEKCKEKERKIAELKRKTQRLTRERCKFTRKANCHQKRHKKKKRDARTKEIVIEKDEEANVETKKDGKFTESMRFCVMELAGLEVATGKMKPVIETVGELCGVGFSDLPSRQKCQDMIDEGHVMAKCFIRERIARCRSFGLHKDGMTRRKAKILDTLIKMDTGESYCLGWSSVVSETGKAIAEEAKDKLGEMPNTSDEGMIEILKKLDYFMNDQAANEKKSSRLLEDWREECLNECGVEDKKRVHHLFCLAHVLLGFHGYVMKGIKKVEGFQSKEFKHEILLLLRDASDVFGPVRDYRGVRNMWEAYCHEREIKSMIKSFKDNRFNGLFEVAAQVYHHHQDFFNILLSLKSRNAKQTRLLKSLQNSKLILLCECLGLFFHKVTGPFWSFVISPKATYSSLTTIVQKMKESLKKCKQDPAFLFNENSFSFLNFRTTSAETKDSLSTAMKIEMKVIIEIISDGILTTLNVQMADFDEGGQYSTEQNLPTSAPLTNLICERHFGHQDASQRRRPHSSLHHHSSVILLKQTRKRMRSWFTSLSDKEKEGMWKKARIEGGKLRRKHQEKDKSMILESIHSLKLAPREVAREELDLVKGQMIAVACEDAWYPAEVQMDSSSAEDVVVSFSELSKGLGMFRWPTGKEIQPVSKRSVLEANLDIEPRAGGRLWYVKNNKEIQQKFRLC